MSTIIAWDIETCPQPVEDFTERQQRRYELLMQAEREKHPHEADDVLSRRVRSFHPMLGFICCVSFQVADIWKGNVQRSEPRSFTATSVEDESLLLIDLAAALDGLRSMERWVTFNGKRFDVEWLVTRSLYHGVSVGNRRMLSRNPYQQEMHTDLACLFRNATGLADLCDHLNVPTPKGSLDGSGVADAVAAGRIDDVARYCERDVAATLECYLITERIAAPAFL